MTDKCSLPTGTVHKSRQESSISDFRYKFAPRVAGWIRPVSVVGACLLDVATAAQALKVRGIVFGAALVHRPNVITFQRSGFPTTNATPIVTLEYAKAKQLPPFAIELREVPAARMLAAHPDIPTYLQPRRRGGRPISGSASPAAITAALNWSIRPRDLALSSPGFPLPSRWIALFAIAVESDKLSRILSFPVSTRRCSARTSRPPSLPAPTRRNS